MHTVRDFLKIMVKYIHTKNLSLLRNKQDIGHIRNYTDEREIMDSHFVCVKGTRIYNE